MSDSRTFSLSKIHRRMERQTKAIMFLSSIVISFILVYVLRGSNFTQTQDYTLFLLFFSIGLWITEAIPPFAVGIMIIGFIVFTMGNVPDVDVKKYVNTWSDGVIWLFLGGFFLAEGMKKTKIDEGLLKLVMPKLGKSAPNVVLGMMFLTAILSMVMSNTATASMVLATVLPLVNKLGKDSPVVKSLMIGIPAAASIGGMGTIIGSAPNAIAVGVLESMGHHVSFIEWMMIGLPIALILVYLFFRLLNRIYKLKGLSLSTDFLNKNVDNVEEENITQKRIVLAIFTITLLLWLTSQWTKIPVAVVSGVPIVLLTMLQIIDSEDVRKLPWDTLMLVAGGLSLGLVIQEQGIASYFVDKIGSLQINYYGILVLFAFITIIFSNFMSNTAAATILIPVGVSLLSIIPNSSPSVLPVVIGLCASCALLLPVSTPPNAVAYSMGVIEQKEFYPGGIFIGILGPVMIIGWSLLFSFLL